MYYLVHNSLQSVPKFKEIATQYCILTDMTHEWLSFCIVITVQFLLFIGIAWYKHDLKNSFKKLLPCLLLGVPFGIGFDLIFGQFLGIYGYVLGFDLPFLVANGFLSFGLAFAALIPLRAVSHREFYVWSIVIGGVYECINYLYPVWSWNLYESMVTTQLVLMLAAYPGLLLLMSIKLYTLRIVQSTYLRSFFTV